MDKRRHNIFIWWTAWASLLLLVLYSPVGTPEFYKPNNYYASANEGRWAYEAKISGGAVYSPIVNKGGNKAAVPTYSAVSNSNRPTTYAISSATSDVIGNDAQPLASNPPITKESKKHVVGNVGFGGGLAGLGRNSSTRFSNIGLISMSTDLSFKAENDITKQGGGLDNPIGTASPGGEPTGPIIPISDGWGFLLAMALVYGVLKRNFFMKS